jgi:outer membrane protein OmpA-like peptidoglycan-associated protein
MKVFTSWASILVLVIAGADPAQAQTQTASTSPTDATSADETAISASQSPTMNFAGDRYRVGVGIDTEFDFFGEFLLTLTENSRSAWLAEGWLGRKGAGGVKLNYHWLFDGESVDGPDGEVYTDGRVAKLFIAADENQRDDRKLTFGGGYEYQDWFFSGYGMRALTDERRVNQFIEFEDIVVNGLIDGRGFTRVDSLERVTDLFEAPYEWGAGLRGGRYFDNQLLRLRGGLDYEDGDYGASQLTASVNLDKFFAYTPHGLSLRAGFARKRGDFEDDRNDLRASLVYSYSFGRRHQPRTAFREEEVQIQPEPRFEERAVASEVTLADRATFDFDSARLQSAAESTLDEVLAAIQDGELVGAIQVGGHTCNIGTERYNQRLSERRAQAVVDYLISRGVAPDQIVARGYGELEPRFSNDSEESRARNRRVEISFVTEQSRTERIRVTPDGPVTEIRQVEVPVEAPWIRRALRNPVQHKRIVDYYRYQEVTETLTEGEIVFDNSAPDAADDQFALQAGSSDNVLDVLANDSDLDGDTLTLTAVGTPANGQVQISGSVLTYTPAAGFTGSDSFSYTVDDGFGGQAQANVSIVISEANENPVAGADTASTRAGQAVSIDVLANDNDADGDSLSVSAFSQAANGTVSQEGNVLIYTPADGFTGSDSFTYVVSDGRGGEASAQVSVTVTAENRPPVANPDFATGAAGEEIVVDVLANDVDPDGDPLTVVKVVKLTVAESTFVINGDGTVSFEIGTLCNGTNIFEYTIADPSGATSSARIEVIRSAPAGDDVKSCLPLT